MRSNLHLPYSVSRDARLEGAQADGTFAMMAPLPTSSPSGDRPELPRVRLDVRTGVGRTASYDFTEEEFLIGGAGGCNLRLSGGAPPVAVQLARKPDGVRVRRMAAGLPVMLVET